MKIKLLALVVGSVALLDLSACSTIKNWFPDKGKDYQFTTEIPELHVPEDLEQNTGIDVASAENNDSPTTEPKEKPVAIKEKQNDESGMVVPPRQAFLTDPAPFAQESNATTTAAPGPNPAVGPQVSPETNEGPAIDLKTVVVELPKFTSNDNHFMRIGLPLRRTWNVLGKALSRNSIEITRRDQEDGFFTVQYDPDEKPASDETIADEINFFLGGFKHNDQEISLKLIENNRQTDVVVVDKNQQPLPDSAGLKLLELLQKTIKADLAK